MVPHPFIAGHVDYTVMNVNKTMDNDFIAHCDIV
jgi:hypothetical protein